MSYVAAFELREFNTSGLTGTFQEVGDPIAAPAVWLSIRNGSNVDVYLSWNETENQIRVDAGQTVSVPSYTRHFVTTRAAVLAPAGGQLWIRQVTGAGVGTVSVNFEEVV